MPARRSAGKPAAQLVIAELTIAEVGARGDGVGLYDDAKVFVPLTVAGDRVRVRLGGSKGDGLRGELLDLIQPGTGRRAEPPPCGHFGTCGGCTLQHMDDDTYAAWKVGIVRTALDRVGLGDAVLEPLARTPPGPRPRARIAA